MQPAVAGTHLKEEQPAVAGTHLKEEPKDTEEQHLKREDTQEQTNATTASGASSASPVVTGPCQRRRAQRTRRAPRALSLHLLLQLLLLLRLRLRSRNVLSGMDL